MTAARFILPGGRADLAERAGSQPVYVMAQFHLGRSALDRVVDHLRREMPSTEFIIARDLYGDLADWQCRWPRERTIYGGAVVVTAADPRVDDDEPQRAGFRGGHEIQAEIACEISAFVAMRRPVAWIGLEGPSMRWLSRFAVEMRMPIGVWVRSDAGAFLYSAIDAEHLAPVISDNILPPRSRLRTVVAGRGA
jgi:hypothetical protein